MPARRGLTGPRSCWGRPGIWRSTGDGSIAPRCLPGWTVALQDAPDLPLRLRADQGGEARGLVALLQDLRSLGAQEVTLITLPEGR